MTAMNLLGKTPAEADRDTAGPVGGVAPFDRHVIAVGAVVFAVLLALSTRYGFHRDELYFMECARHLQASYVDQPVLTPLLAWVSLKLFGVSLLGLRMWPALAAWATVVLAGLTAREFGGGRRGQLLAAVATATMPVVLGGDHLFGPTAFDMLAWAALALVAARIGRTGDVRWWPAGGLVLGLGLANKHSVGLFAVALVIGALLSGGRRLVLNRWFAAGAVIAAAFTIPDVWWQAQHQWATIAMSRALAQENGGLVNIASWVIGQLTMFRPGPGGGLGGRAALPVAVRPAALACPGVGVRAAVRVLRAHHGREDLLPGGRVHLPPRGRGGRHRRLAGRPRRPGRRLLLATAVTTAVAVPLVLPVLPAGDVGWTQKIDPVLAESVGWPQLVGTVRTAWFSLPASQRASAVIFTSNYGEASAINVLGQGTGLPQAVSGHNTYWWCGPGDPQATTVVAVMPGPADGGGDAAYLGQFFTSVRAVATLSNPYGLHNQEWHGHVYLCTGPRRPWGQIWPQLRQYS